MAPTLGWLLTFAFMSRIDGFQPSGAAAPRSVGRRAAADEMDPEKFQKALKGMTLRVDAAFPSRPSARAYAARRRFSNRYAKVSQTKFCSEPSVPAFVIRGLAENKVTLGVPLCPCRHYDDKAAEAKKGYWNCPCVPMREEKKCHCMLFLTEDNDFAGDSAEISVDEVIKIASSNPDI